MFVFSLPFRRTFRITVLLDDVFAFNQILPIADIWAGNHVSSVVSL